MKVINRFSNKNGVNAKRLPRLVRIHRYGNGVAPRIRNMILFDSHLGMIDCINEQKALRLQLLWMNAKCERKHRKWLHAYESFLKSKRIKWSNQNIDDLIRWNFITSDHLQSITKSNTNNQ